MSKKTNGEDYFTPEILNEIFKYDLETGKLYWEKRGRDLGEYLNMSDKGIKVFNTQRAGKECIYKFSTGYLGVQMVLGGRTYRMLQHRVIYAMVHGVWPNVIDHIDGNKTNNKISNLRDTDHTNNQYNASKRSGCSSPKIGVSYKKDKKKWKAYAFVDKQIHLGYFRTEEEAVQARLDWENATDFTFRS